MFSLLLSLLLPLIATLSVRSEALASAGGERTASTLSSSTTSLVRVAGDPTVQPDSPTVSMIERSGVGRVIGVFDVCVDASGAVVDVRVLRSTAFLAYDAMIARRIRTWTYRPVLREGTPVPACTRVTFVYRRSQ